MNNRQFEAYKAKLTAYDKAIEGADESKTFTGLKKRLYACRTYLKQERDEIGTKPLPDPRFDERKFRADLQAAYIQHVKEIKAGALEEVNSTIEEKKNKVHEMVMQPPTSSHMALLQALLMRSNLSPEEIEEVANGLMNDFTALKVLEDIAAKNGYRLDMPMNTNISEMMKALDTAQDYLTGAIADLDKFSSREGSNARYLYFFGGPGPNGEDGNDREFQTIIDALDSTPQMNTFHVAAGNSPVEEAVVQQLFSKIDTSKSATTFAAQIHDILESHPESREIMEKSRTWGDAVKSTEAIYELAGKTMLAPEQTAHDKAEMPYYQRAL